MTINCGKRSSLDLQILKHEVSKKELQNPRSEEPSEIGVREHQADLRRHLRQLKLLKRRSSHYKISIKLTSTWNSNRYNPDIFLNFSNSKNLNFSKKVAWWSINFEKLDQKLIHITCILFTDRNVPNTLFFHSSPSIFFSVRNLLIHNWYMIQN